MSGSQAQLRSALRFPYRIPMNKKGKVKQYVLPEHAETSLPGVGPLWLALPLETTQPKSYWQAAVHKIWSVEAVA